MILAVASRSEMNFEFECEGSNGATMSSYSYLKESSLQYSGYTRGLKAGSFNYLENGDINLAEKIIYNPGNGTSKGNSTYNHKMNLNFMGEKGISEFYGKEYFKNNKAISAWKKIRYEDIKEKYINLGDENLAKNIVVRADLNMDTTPGYGYDLKYNATVKGGVVETWDSLGWSNRTGARRIEWEHNALMHGDIKVTNNLRESAPLEAHAGDEDWLPCGFCGTKPAIEPINSPWPAPIVIKALEADKILPQKECNRIIAECIKNGTNRTKCHIPEGCRNLTCTDNNCTGYELIYTYNQGGQRTIEPYAGTVKSLKIEEHTYQAITDNEVIFTIEIKNSGDVKVQDIAVDEVLPLGMVYIVNSTSPSGEIDKPKQIVNAEGTILTWAIGNVTSDQSRTIKFRAAGSATRASDARATASGTALGVPLVTPSIKAHEDIGALG